MLLLLLEAAILIGLLKVVTDGEIGMLLGVVIALITSIVTGILAAVLILLIGIAGIFVAGILGAVGLGLAVSGLFGVEMKKALIVASIFMIVHIGLSFVLQSFAAPS